MKKIISNNSIHQIVHAIRNLDIQKLDVLLEDRKAYMDVPKALFLNTLNKKFQFLKNHGIIQFDEVHPGICQKCNKGCKGITFLSDQGFYLDFFIESEENAIKDIYVCNRIINEKELEKDFDLGFHFKKDEETKFTPTPQYRFIQNEYHLLLDDINKLNKPTTLNKVELLYNAYRQLDTTYQSIDFFDSLDYRLYSNVSKTLSVIRTALDIKKQASRAIDGIADYYSLKNEREKLIWYYKNRDHISKLIYFKKKMEKDQPILLYREEFELKVTYHHYEYVLDYFSAINDTYDYFMNKYKPLDVHFANSPNGEVNYSLESFLSLHGVYEDVMKNFNDVRSLK